MSVLKSVQLRGYPSRLLLAHLGAPRISALKTFPVVTPGSHDGSVARTPLPFEPFLPTPLEEPRDLPDCDVVDRPDDVPPTKSPFNDDSE